MSSFGDRGVPPDVRRFLDTALAEEPSLDANARARMRTNVLAAMTGTAAVTAAATTALHEGALDGASNAGSAATAGASTLTAGVASGGAKALATKAVVTLLVLGAGAGVSIARRQREPAPMTVRATAITAPAVDRAAPPSIPQSVGEATPAVSLDSLPDVAPRTAGAAAVARASSPPTPRAKEDESDGAKRGPSFAEQLGAVERARKALAAGDGALALKELGHDALRSSTVFEEERDALRIVALCSLGRSADAQAPRDAFERAFSRSVHRARIERACEESGDGSPHGRSLTGSAPNE